MPSEGRVCARHWALLLPRPGRLCREPRPPPAISSCEVGELAHSLGGRSEPLAARCSALPGLRVPLSSLCVGSGW